MAAAGAIHLRELFDGKLTNLAKKEDAQVSDVEGKVVALYFSAHWCPPCRAFTPTLIKAYNDAKAAGANFELVFVSSDEDVEGFDDYTKDMPWLAVKFDDEEARSQIGEKFGIKGIPALIIVGKDGKIITQDGRTPVSKEKDAAFVQWAKL